MPRAASGLFGQRLKSLCVFFTAYGAATLHGGAQCVPCVSNGPVTASGPLESPELLRSGARPLLPSPLVLVPDCALHAPPWILALD